MAENQTDQSQKTEEPTPKRLEDARKKGQVPSSREVQHWFMILAGTIMIMAFAPAMMSDFKAISLKFIESPHAIPLDAVSEIVTAQRSRLKAVQGRVVVLVRGNVVPVVRIDHAQSYGDAALEPDRQAAGR